MYEDNAAKDLKSTIRKAGDRAMDQVQKTEGNLVEAGQKAVQSASDYYQEAKSSLSQWLDNSVDYMKKNPARSVLGAVAVGYFLGIVSRRRSS